VSVKRAASGSSGKVGAPNDAATPRVGRRSLGTTFSRLWWATGISSSGDGLLVVAMPLLALTLTRSPLLIAGLTGANRAARAIAALPGGVIADRWDRRNVMVVCNLVAGVTLLALVASLTVGWAELVALYVVATVVAACDITYTLAVQASLPDAVSADRLAVANGRLIAVEGAGEQFIGPASGGILFAFARRLPFFADGISFFVSALLIRAGLPTGPQGDRPTVVPTDAARATPRAGDAAVKASPGGARTNGSHPHGPAMEGKGDMADLGDVQAGHLERAQRRQRWVADFRQGFRVFRGDRALKLLAAMASFGALCQTMVLAILVLYGEQTLHLTSTGYGFFYAFAALIGVVGAHFAGHMQDRFGPGQLIIGGLMLSVVSYIGLAFTHSAVPAVFVFGLQEIGTVAATVGSVTTRQRVIPRQLYGRVGSVHRLAGLSAGVAGALIGGFIASAFTVAATMLTAGALLLVATVVLGPPLLRTLATKGGSSTWPG
jgi:MFS family permease